MFEEILLSQKDVNIHYLKRYLRLINEFKNKETRVECVHHILPRNKECWPEYKNLKKYQWNSIKLTNRQHFILHYILYKAFPQRKNLLYAFNMMSSFYNERKTSRMYENARKDISKLISNTNSGLKRSDDIKRKSSKRMKNKICVFDINDDSRKLFQIDKNSIEYNPDIHKFYRTGFKHKDVTKTKIGKRGKKWVNDGVNSKMVYLDEIPENFKLGFIIKSDKSYLHNRIWSYNIETKEEKRLEKELIVHPWYVGRLSLKENNPGLHVINNLYPVIDLTLNTSTKVKYVDKKIHAPECSIAKDKIIIYTYNNLIFSSFKKLSSYCEENNVYLNDVVNRQFDDDIIKKPHFNNTIDKKMFREKHNGKKYSELGFKTYKLQDFKLDEHKDKEIYWND